jgi:DNA polymerase III delta prime subunit
MSDINKLLLWERWRPKNLEDIILLPRIRKHFESGVTQNYIFHGHFGTGKTSLARILIGKYTKDKPHLELNSSLFTSIDTLRNEIENFCKNSSLMDDYDMKYVFLDEFERVSAQFQDAFKAFIEKYSKNVRFIITTNHINKVSDGIKSRIAKIDFDCQTPDEEKFLKQEIYKKIFNQILPKEGVQIPKEEIVSIIKKKFPDFRNILVECQNFLQIGNSGNLTQTGLINAKELYGIIYDKSLDYEQIYHYLMKNFGPEKIDLMISLLGRPFVDWVLSEKSEDIQKLFHLNFIISDYSSKLETNTDPIILGLTIIGKFRDIVAQ